MARFSVTSIFNQLKSRKKPHTPIPQKVWESPSYFLAFGLGSGTLPLAPGTFGTLMAIPFYLLLEPLPLLAYVIFVVFFIAISSLICDRVSREINVHDHPGIVIDEFAGYFITMIHAPHGALWVILGFLLFRLFDVWKPWPIRFLDEKIHGGFGIVLDDVIAGVYALVVMQIIMVICRSF